jgi:hypothetical protein
VSDQYTNQQWVLLKAELERVKDGHAAAIRQEHMEQVRLINDRDALRAHAEALAEAMRGLLRPHNYTEVRRAQKALAAWDKEAGK